MSPQPSLSLGLDLSTQQLKIVAIDVRTLETFYEKSLTFETDLPWYDSRKGVYSNESDEVYSPVEMWVQALDMILAEMVHDGFPFGRASVVSGACQVLPSGLYNPSNMPRFSGLERRRGYFRRWTVVRHYESRYVRKDYRRPTRRIGKTIRLPRNVMSSRRKLAARKPWPR
jgi:hypothetical protein